MRLIRERYKRHQLSQGPHDIKQPGKYIDASKSNTLQGTQNKSSQYAYS